MFLEFNVGLIENANKVFDEMILWVLCDFNDWNDFDIFLHLLWLLGP